MHTTYHLKNQKADEDTMTPTTMHVYKDCDDEWRWGGSVGFSDSMYRDDVSLEIILVGGHVVAQVARETPPLVHRLHVDPAHYGFFRRDKTSIITAPCNCQRSAAILHGYYSY